MNTRHWVRQFKNIFLKRSLVLMYHRIADVPVDPWQLAVSPEHFEQHLQVLRDTYPLITAKAVAQQVRERTIVKNTISLTFDDGYSDNFLSAKPLLEKYNCPATFFIASHFIGKDHEFWWDALVGILLLSEKLPVDLGIVINGEALHFELDHEGILQPGEMGKHASWLWPETPPTRRAEIYLAIWERLKPLPYAAIEVVLGTLKNWAGSAYLPPAANFPMAEQQLNELFAHRLIDIGIHTVTHPALSVHPKAFQYDEVNQCKEQLERLGGRPMEIIAYPYGDHNQTTMATINELHLSGAFTTADTAVDKNTQPFQIGRLQVKNWDGPTFKRQLNRWLNGR